VQDSQRVYGYEAVDPVLLRHQAEVVLADLPVAAIKLGMLGSGAIARVIHALLTAHPTIPVVLDPVLAANSGGNLADDDLAQALLRLFPLTTLITPNTVEARRLGGSDKLDVAVAALRAHGARHILLKGGHEPSVPMPVPANATGGMLNARFKPALVNRLYDENGLLRESHLRRLPGEYHGSGCTLASAIACGLAAGLSLPAAVAHAETFVTEALVCADRPHADGQFLPLRVSPNRDHDLSATADLS
jgi:hydroxymethylpyrimidine/phosphomethylpyrimidine kinase